MQAFFSPPPSIPHQRSFFPLQFFSPLFFALFYLFYGWAWLHFRRDFARPFNNLPAIVTPVFSPHSRLDLFPPSPPFLVIIPQTVEFVFAY